MSEYAPAPDPEVCFDAARTLLEQMIVAAREHGASGDWSADAAEMAVVGDGRAVELAVLQGFLNARAAAEVDAPAAAVRAPRIACRIKSGDGSLPLEVQTGQA